MAVEFYDSALKLDITYGKAWKNKAKSLYKLKKYEDALKASNSAIKINP
jgi:tetratricopeptide (TPR) repeat protein